MHGCAAPGGMLTSRQGEVGSRTHAWQAALTVVSGAGSDGCQPSLLYVVESGALSLYRPLHAHNLSTGLPLASSSSTRKHNAILGIHASPHRQANAQEARKAPSLNSQHALTHACHAASTILPLPLCSRGHCCPRADVTRPHIMPCCSLQGLVTRPTPAPETRAGGALHAQTGRGRGADLPSIKAHSTHATGANNLHTPDILPLPRINVRCKCVACTAEA